MESIVNMLAEIMGGLQKNVDFYLRGHKSPGKFEVWALGYVPPDLTRVVIHLAGLFGWIGMHHAFQVLTRILQALCRHIISGLCYWCVDDLMAVSLAKLYINDSTPELTRPI